MQQHQKILIAIFWIYCIIISSKEVESRPINSTVYRDLDLMHEYVKHKNFMQKINSDGKILLCYLI
jgi:hypothetical protein